MLRMIALVQGFKMPREEFRVFLAAKAHTALPDGFMSKEYRDYISKAIGTLNLNLDREVMVFLPDVQDHPTSEYVLVCCNWSKVFDFAEVDDISEDSVPCGFEKLRDVLQPNEPIKNYVVRNDSLTYDSYVSDFEEYINIPAHRAKNKRVSGPPSKCEDEDILGAEVDERKVEEGLEEKHGESKLK